MNKADYYKILGLEKNASEEDIKKAYRRLAMKYHPDRNQGESAKEAEETFKQVKEAYETLSDNEKRRMYDQFGHTDNPFQNSGTTRTWTFNQGQGSVEDIFRDLFGENSPFGQHGPFSEGIFVNRPRQDIQIVNISLADAYKGITIKIHGNISANLPAGIRSGTRFFHDGKLFRVDIQPHHKFKRSNDDLLVDIEINAFEAMIGANAVITHLDNTKLQFNIPSSIQNGQIIRLSNKGMKNPETDIYGDLLIRITITIPRLSEEEKSKLSDFNHRETIDI